MEAVKPRPPTRTNRDKTKRVISEKPEPLDSHEEIAHIENLRNDSQMETLASVKSPETPQDLTDSATTTSIGNLKAPDSIPPVNLPFDKSRINHFLIYPLHINIVTANWDKMLNFYEEVLELPMAHHPENEMCGFVAGNVGFFLTKNSISSGNPQNNLQIILATDLTLSHLSRKLETRGIKAERKDLNYINSRCCETSSMPVVQINDPDGNRVLIASINPEKIEKTLRS